MWAPILNYPNLKKEFFIETDALSTGMGAVLSQVWNKDGEDKLLPVAYASKTFKGAEINYSTTDKEGLAVVWSVNILSLMYLV